MAQQDMVPLPPADAYMLLEESWQLHLAAYASVVGAFVPRATVVIVLDAA